MKRERLQHMLAPALWGAALCLGIAGCTATDVEEGGSPSGKLPEVEAHLYLNVLSNTPSRTRSLTFTARGTREEEEEEAPATRAAGLSEAQENKLHTLWAGQYAGGTQVGCSYTDSLELQSEAHLKLSKIAGESHIYLVANAGDLTTTTQGLDEAAFKALVTSQAFNAAGQPAGDRCIMTGLLKKEVAGNIEGTVSLTRTLAKILFSYTIDATGFSFVPTSLTLCQVPGKLHYIQPETGKQPADMTYTTYAATPSAGSGTFCWYLPENPAGVVTAPADSVAKTEKEKTGAGTRNATYICLMGNATQGGVTYKNVTFKLYPGNVREQQGEEPNGMNNYNIDRNSLYAIAITLTGIDFSDKRVTLTEAPAMTNPRKLASARGAKDTLLVTIQPGKEWQFVVPAWLAAVIIPPAGSLTPPDTARAGSQVVHHGPAAVQFIAQSANPTPQERALTFKVDTTDITVAQEGSTFSVPTSALRINASVDSLAEASFTATAGLLWTASLTADWGEWLTWQTSGFASSGEATGSTQALPLKSAFSNPSASERTGTLKLHGGDLMDGFNEEIRITQTGSRVIGATDTLSAVALDTVATFSAPRGLDWSATLVGTPDWFSLTGTTAGIQNTTGKPQHLDIQVLTVNPDSTLRTATITVHAGNAAGSEHAGPSGTVTVRQRGSVFQVDSTFLGLDTTACENSLQVTATPGLPWTLTKKTGSDANITASPESGSGSQQVTFSAPANKGSARTALFTFAVTGSSQKRDHAVTVTQKGKLLNSLTVTNRYIAGYRALVGGNTNFPSVDESIETKDIRVSMTASGKMTWATASTYCNSLAESGNWRLPTLYELYIIYANKSYLEKTVPIFTGEYWSGSPFATNNYISCMELSPRAQFNYRNQTATYYVRCVQDE